MFPPSPTRPKAGAAIRLARSNLDTIVPRSVSERATARVMQRCSISPVLLGPRLGWPSQASMRHRTTSLLAFSDQPADGTPYTVTPKGEEQVQLRHREGFQTISSRVEYMKEEKKKEKKRKIGAMSCHYPVATQAITGIERPLLMKSSRGVGKQPLPTFHFLSLSAT